MAPKQTDTQAHAPDTWIRTPVSDSSEYLDSPPGLKLSDLDPDERSRVEAELAKHYQGNDNQRGLSLSDYDLSSAPYTGSLYGDFYGADDTGEHDPKGGTSGTPPAAEPPAEPPADVQGSDAQGSGTPPPAEPPKQP
jgi:hypothetical protein